MADFSCNRYSASSQISAVRYIQPGFINSIWLDLVRILRIDFSCSIRTIPLPDELYNILIKHQKPSRGYLLTNDDNKFIEPRTLQNRFKKILKDIHIADTNFHTLRHTFATRCIELGFDIKSLSEILGHATVNITMNRYVHPTLEMKKENMQKLSHFLAVK